MANKRTGDGLVLRGRVWHVEWSFKGKKVRQSTKCRDLKTAKEVMQKIKEAHVRGELLGDARPITFAEAAAKFVETQSHKRSIASDVRRLNTLVQQFGEFPLADLNMSTLQPWIAIRKANGNKTATINHDIQICRRITRLASSVWHDEFNNPWLKSAPKFVTLRVEDQEPIPYVTVEQQNRFLRELKADRQDELEFVANTGCRDNEVVGLLWANERISVERNLHVFKIGNVDSKNNVWKVVVLNRYAREVIERRRGQHPTHVFGVDGKPTTRIFNSQWTRVRELTGLAIGPHMIRHAFGTRLRMAGVREEDRQVLMGHRGKSITTHYSTPDISRLLEFLERLAPDDGSPIPEPAVSVSDLWLQ